MSTHKGIDRTLQKLKHSVEAGNYYEAHQMYRTIANRHMKAKQYQDAIPLLYSGSLQLLKHKQGGSGADLGLYFLEAYNAADVKVNAESLGQVTDLLDYFSPEEPQRGAFIKNAVIWTQKHGEFPAGDPELHHYIGMILWNEKHYPEAELHFLAGTEQSAISLGHLEHEWAVSQLASDKGTYLARAVLQYLAQKHIHDATLCLEAFDTDIRQSGSPELQNLPFKSAPADPPIQVAIAKQGEPMLNFVRLAVLTCQRNAKDLFMELRETYKPFLGKQKEFAELLNTIGETFFGISKPKAQANPLADLMSSLFSSPAAPQGRRTGSGGGSAVASADLD